MANEFRVRKGLIVNGSGSVILDIQGSQGQLFSVTDQLSGSLFSVKDISGIPVMEAFSDNRVNIGTYNLEAIKVSGSFARITGSLFGTASSATSASFATTASFALNAGGGGSSFPYTGSAIISGSLRVTGSASILGSGSRIFTISGSTGGLLEIGDGGANDVFSISSGSVEIFRIDNTKAVSISGSLIVTGSITGSLLGTASYATQALSSSYALTASFALNAGSGGSGGGTTYPVTTAGISIADPTAAEDVTLLYTSASIIVAAVEGVLRGSAIPTASINLRYDADRNATGTLIVSASRVTSTTTGNNLTLTANTTVPAFNFIWLETTLIGGTVNELFVGVLFASGSV